MDSEWKCQLVEAHVPTVTTRILGAGLQNAMTAAKLHRGEAARELHWERSRLIRVLSGERRACAEDVATFLTMSGVMSGWDRDRLLTLARRDLARRGKEYELSWWQEHDDDLRSRFAALDYLQSTAESVDSYYPTVIPAILQTEAYTRALLGADPNVPLIEIDEHVTRQRERQATDQRERPPSRYFLTEHAVTHSGLDPRLMSARVRQLLHLDTRHNIEIRIVPASSRLRECPSFQLFAFRKLRSIVYLESLTSTQLLEHEVSVTAYRNLVESLHRAALDRMRSREWLTHQQTPELVAN